MINMTSTEAKTHFGALLDMAQRNPVTIQKKGRPVEVILSQSEYTAYQQLKLQVLQNDLNAGIHQADQGLLIDATQLSMVSFKAYGKRKITPLALNDLKEIRDFIAKDKSRIASQ